MRRPKFITELIFGVLLVSSVFANAAFNDLIKSYTCSTCPGPTASFSSCQKAYTASALSGYEGAHQSAVGTWARFSSPLLDDYINIFVLGRASSSSAGLMSDYRYHSLYLQKSDALSMSQRLQLDSQTSSDADFSSYVSGSFTSGTWYFFYSSVVIDPQNGSSFYGYYDPISQGSPLSWKYSQSTNFQASAVFESDIKLSFGVFDANYMTKFPCVSFAGAFAIASYFDDPKVIYQWIGLHKANVIVLYVFDSQDNGVILDRSGNEYNGIIGQDRDFAPYWDASNSASVQAGPSFKGNELIISRPFEFSSYLDSVFVFGTTITVQFSKNQSPFCNITGKTDYILFQLLQENATGKQTVLALGTNYLNASSLQLIVIDKAGTKVILPKILDTDTWIQVNMFCGDYTRSTTLPSNITCTVYFGDSNEYMDVLTVKSFQASAGDTFFTAIGDACDSFCGNVKKFLFFSNTTSYQSPISSQPTCDLILGTVNPICLTTYEGVTTFCGVGEYTKNQNSCASCQSKCLDCSAPNSCFACADTFFVHGNTCSKSGKAPGPSCSQSLSQTVLPHPGVVVPTPQTSSNDSNSTAGNTTNQSTTPTTNESTTINKTTPTNDTSAANESTTINDTVPINNSSPANDSASNGTAPADSAPDEKNSGGGSSKPSKSSPPKSSLPPSLPPSSSATEDTPDNSCDPNCQICSSNNSCTTCLPGYYLLEGNCAQDCPQGHYKNTTTGACASCNSPCATCFAAGPNGCLSCHNPLVLHQSQCRPSCPSFSLYDTNLNKCVDCYSGCLACHTLKQTGCSLCQSGLYLFKGRCLKKCPTNYYSSTDSPGPVCKQKTFSRMTLSTTSFPESFLLVLNTTTTTFLNYIQKNVKVKLGDSILESANFSVSIYDSNSVLLRLLSNSYVSKGTLLEVTVTDCNQDLSEMIALENNAAAVNTLEIPADSNSIEKAISLAALSGDLGYGLLSSQLVSLVASYGSSVSLAKLQNYRVMLQMMSNSNTNSPSVLNSYFGSNPASPNSQSKRRMLESGQDMEPSETSIKRGFISIFGWELTGGLLLLAIGSAVFLLAKISRKAKNFHRKHKKMYNLLVFIDELLNWNVIFNYFAFIVFQGTYYSLNEIAFAIRERAVSNMGSLLCSGLFIVLNVASTLLLTIEIAKKRSEAKHRKNSEPSALSRRLSILSSDYKDPHSFYLPLFLSRILLTSLLLVVLEESPFIQTLLILIINGAFLFYCLTYTPFKSKIITLLTLVIEVLILIASICNVYFAGAESSQNTLDNRTTAAMVYINCSIGVLITGLLMSAIQVLHFGADIIRSCRKKFVFRFSSKTVRPEKFEYEQEEGPIIEDVWSHWRKSITVVPKTDWTKPENREKMLEISNWVRELLGASLDSQTMISITESDFVNLQVKTTELEKKTTESLKETPRISRSSTDTDAKDV